MAKRCFETSEKLSFWIAASNVRWSDRRMAQADFVGVWLHINGFGRLSGQS